MKSLLLQLLDQRIGNLQLYRALIDTFKQSKQTSDLAAYEDWLWKAFSTVVGETLTGAKDLVVLVDGLDEINSASSSPQKLFDRLRQSCSKFNNVKLITLSQPTAVPSDHSNRLELGLNYLSEDISAVARRTLSKFKPFTSQNFTEQENILEHITRASNGSFLWTKLIIKLCERQKSDDLIKSVDAAAKAQRTVSDLVLQHLTVHELADTTKSILSFLTVAERPLTTAELSKCYVLVGQVMFSG